MRVPLTDLEKLHSPIRDEINEAIKKIIDDNSYILGTYVEDFEKNFAAAHDVKHCIGVSSGTAANHLILWSLGIGAGDEVIIPANTFIATAWGAVLCGAIPVFADCENQSYNLDWKKIENKITKKTKAITAVHLYGQPADMDEIRKISEKHNLILVEDAAQSHLAEYKGKKVGELSRAASFSFYPGKNLGAFGEAGAVTTDDDELAKKIRMMRDHGSGKKYHHDIFGHNYRMEAIQGAVLGIKLKHLKNWTEQRRTAAEIYFENLKTTDEILLPGEMNYSKHVYHQFVIQTKQRDELSKFLNDNGISTALHYPVPLHLQKCFAKYGYKRGDFPQSEKLAEECLSLPVYPDLSREQIVYVCDKIKHFFKR